MIQGYFKRRLKRKIILEFRKTILLEQLKHCLELHHPLYYENASLHLFKYKNKTIKDLFNVSTVYNGVKSNLSNEYYKDDYLHIIKMVKTRCNIDINENMTLSNIMRLPGGSIN